jgi:hypothetical protein
MKRDLLSIVNNMVEVWNDHDLDGVLGFFSDDAIARLDAMPKEFVGKDGIREWIEDSFNNNIHISELRNIEVEEDKVTWNAYIHLDRIANAGVENFCPTIRIVFADDGKIRYFIAMLEDETKEKLRPLMAEQMSK